MIPFQDFGEKDFPTNMGKGINISPVHFPTNLQPIDKISMLIHGKNIFNKINK